MWLTLAEMEGSAQITLNGRLLGETQDAPYEGDVTALLGPRNRLEILARGRSVGEVALEVRAAAFLTSVKLSRISGKLHVEGVVAEIRR